RTRRAGIHLRLQVQALRRAAPSPFYVRTPGICAVLKSVHSVSSQNSSNDFLKNFRGPSRVSSMCGYLEEVIGAKELQPRTTAVSPGWSQPLPLSMGGVPSPPYWRLSLDQIVFH